jgi:ligand-binding sensor protein
MIDNKFLALTDDLLDIISRDENWSKAQTVAQELTGGKLSIIDSTDVFIDDRHFHDFCQWIQSFPASKESCRHCLSTNCFNTPFQSKKSHFFRCQIGLTHFVIRLLPQFAILSGPILCSDFDVNDYVKYAEEFGLPTDKGFNLLDKLRSNGQIKQNHLRLVLDLITSLLEPLEAKLTGLIPSENSEPPLKIVTQIETRERGLSSIAILNHRKHEGRRAVITGLGVVSPIGIGKDEFLDGLLKSKNGVHRITSFDPSDLPSQMAGEVNDFDPSKYLDHKSISHTARASQFAVAGTQMALEDAQLIIEEEDPDRIAVIIGAGTNGMEFAAEQCKYFYAAQGKKPVSPYTGVIVFAGACSGEVSIRFGLKGLSHTISTGCTSSNDAIGSSLRFIRGGEADVVITGGTDAAIIPITVSACFYASIVTTERYARRSFSSI